MVKKVFDILPPQEDEEEKEEFVEIRKEEKIEVRSFVEPVEQEEKMPEEEIMPEAETSSSRDVSFNFSSIILIVALISVGVFCYFNFTKAMIDIYPVAETSTFQAELVINKDVNAVSSSAIPGMVYTAEKEVSQEFTASGKTMKESRAEGIIRVYNAYSTSPQTLVTNTRLISTDGKLFRLKSKINVPGGHYEGGELVPGFIDAGVMADQAGEEFNIKASSFSIPGFAGTDRYTYFYGKSFEAMSGGFKQEIAQVTQKDLDKAKEILEKRVKEECVQELKAKVSSESGLVLLDDVIQIEILNDSSLPEVGQEGSSFNFTVKAKSSALAFKSQDEHDFIINFISSEIASDKNIHQEGLDIGRTINKIDMDSGKVNLLLRVRAKIYSEVDEDGLRQALKGKSLSETQLYLESYPQLTKSSVTFWPFWVKKVPQKDERIKIQLRLD